MQMNRQPCLPDPSLLTIFACELKDFTWPCFFRMICILTGKKKRKMMKTKICHSGQAIKILLDNFCLISLLYSCE